MCRSSCIRGGQGDDYRALEENFVEWCKLQLNTNKRDGGKLQVVQASHIVGDDVEVYIL